MGETSDVSANGSWCCLWVASARRNTKVARYPNWVHRLLLLIRRLFRLEISYWLRDCGRCCNGVIGLSVPLVAKFKLIRSRLTKSGFTLTTRSLYEMAILGDEWHWRLLDAQVPAE